MEPDLVPTRASLGRQLVVLSLATGLMLGGAVAAVAAWAGSTTPARAVSDSVADSTREGAAFAEARRDALATSMAGLSGVQDVGGRGEPGHADAKGAQVVSLSVTMSPAASVAQVDRVLDTAEASSLVLPRDHFLKVWPRTVVTLVTGPVSISVGGGTVAQAQAIVGLRDDGRVASARITFSPAGTRSSGAGTVTATAHAEAREVRATWAEQLATAFPAVRSWEFG